MTKLQFVAACFTTLIVGAGIIAVERIALARASSENTTLRERLARLNAKPKSPPPAVQPPKNDRTEIDRLRALVNTQTAELSALHKQIDNLAPRPLPASFPFSMLTIKLPRDAWSFAGYATPEDALQSALCAARDGDAAALRSSLSPQSLTQRGWDRKTDAEIIAEAAQAISNATGIEILKYEVQNNDQRAHLTIYLDGVPQASQPLWIDFDKIGNDWKCNYN